MYRLNGYPMPSMSYEPLSSLVDEIEKQLNIAYRKPPPPTWEERVEAMFKPYFTRGFSPPHIEFWQWVDAITPDTAPRPFCAFWSRGRGKSTNAEAATAYLGARETRRYCMYVSGTQDQADKHVATIARMLESDGVTQFYPDVGRPLLGRNGSRTWNRQMLTAANEYTVEAIGLNKAVRGQKIDWARPDLIIFDDVDEKHDSELTIGKKLEIITASILPAGSANCAVLFVQNLIGADSIATMLATPAASGGAGFMTDRVVSGPFPAVEGLEYELREQPDGTYRWCITAGTPLWAGFEEDVCEAELNRVGPTSFESEYQHNIEADNPHALMTEEDFERTRVTTAPALAYIGIGVDPPGGATECGIVAGGRVKIGGDWHGYRLEDNTKPAGCKPEQWALAVLQTYYRTKADAIYVERNYGGDMVASTIRQAKWLDADGNTIIDGRRVNIIEVQATRGKQVRAQPVATAQQQGRIHTVGHMKKLEREWRQWVPGDDSPNRLDADVWLMTGLGLAGAGELPKDPPKQKSKWTTDASAALPPARPGRWRKY